MKLKIVDVDLTPREVVGTVLVVTAVFGVIAGLALASQGRPLPVEEQEIGKPTKYESHSGTFVVAVVVIGCVWAATDDYLETVERAVISAGKSMPS